ncbi:uncharacterized protein KIAA1143 homolog [Neocloeon triangulifer]|uniref:uncharacterized protein KIAA1143 homolog n=1 Tax=Neocloeon triangulifer TaxID=2078957 RepID=UPI00286F0E2B|nr:uncharacterized protein KIAA1143 homolog [Neocloeon triangulifer]
MPRRNVGFIKPPEPAFITKMKQDIGWTEGPNVETKRETLSTATEDDENDRDDESPTIVVLKKGDLTAEEAKLEVEKKQKIEDQTPADLGGRIMFKKPEKRSTETPSSSKDNLDSKKAKIDKKKDKGKSSKSVKNDKKLLSFDDEEEDF